MGAAELSQTRFLFEIRPHPAPERGVLVAGHGADRKVNFGGAAGVVTGYVTGFDSFEGFVARAVAYTYSHSSDKRLLQFRIY